MTSAPPADLHLVVRRRCAELALEVNADNIAAVLRDVAPLMSHAARLATVNDILLQFEGMGPLAAILADPDVTDVVVNSFDQVWIDRGQGMERVPCGWQDESHLRNFAIRLASLANRRLDEAVPWVDARLANGIRLHAIIPPLSVNGTSISLRVPSLKTLTLERLVHLGAMSPAGASTLKQVVRAGLSFVVCGGTGSGKTTVLNAMLAQVPDEDRIVVIEDSTELSIDHPHVVSLASRAANVEGVGEVTMRTLVRQALRMRPDRLIVGEVRGVEVVDVLAAFNTGHEGGAVTIHANSAQSVPIRFETLGFMANLPSHATHAQVAGGIDVIVELGRSVTGKRQARALHVLSLNSAGMTVVAPALDLVTDQEFEPGFDHLQNLLDRGAPS